MKEFLAKIRDRDFSLEDPGLLKQLFKHKRFLRIEGTASEILHPSDIDNTNQLKDVRLSSRGYKLVGRRKLFQ